MTITERSQSIWRIGAAPQEALPLEGDISCDVCVVGAGIAGMTSAYLLGRAGLSVVVVESKTVGAGETGQTTAHLSSALDDRFSHLEKLFGISGARLAYQSHASAIDQIEQIVSHEGIECQFERVDGYLFATDPADTGSLRQELRAAERAGFFGVEWLFSAPWARLSTGPCIRFPRQGQFHPLRYLEGLWQAIVAEGGRVYGQTHVTGIEDGSPCVVATRGGHQVLARHVVVATNSPISDRFAIHSKQAPYRTFAIAARMRGAPPPHALYWDNGDPYLYVRFAGEGDQHLVIIGGQDHKTGYEDDHDQRYFDLELWGRTHFADMGDVVAAWSGQVWEPADSLAYLGKDPGSEHVYVITGDSGHGMTHGTLGAMLIRDSILGIENPFAKLYEPSRKPATLTYLQENAAVLSRYAQWLAPTLSQDIAPGQGAIVTRGARKLAVYRDLSGHYCALSAKCPHLGGQVEWNSAEKSWDCPCHGSRFSATGEVLTGPSTEDLRFLGHVQVGSDARPMARVERGLLAGAVATVAMSAVMLVGKKLGLLGQAPPKKITQRVLDAFVPRSRPTWVENAATVGAHFGYGMAVGGLFSLLTPPSPSTAPVSRGVAFGAALWGANYGGLLPALGILNPPSSDRPGRPTTMLLAHMIYGAVCASTLTPRSPKGHDRPVQAL